MNEEVITHWGGGAVAPETNTRITTIFLIISTKIN
jgi:hypothetical protein